MQYLRSIWKFITDSLEALAEDDHDRRAQEARDRDKRDRWLTYLGSGKKW